MTTDHLHSADASTGPRNFFRGKTLASEWAGRVKSGFNGAPEFLPGKEGRRAYNGAAFLGFNGAPEFLPGKEGG